LFKLIIIDDEPLLLDTLSSAAKWENYGFELCASFYDSSKAMEYIKKNHVDVVFSDIRMPKVSGIDLAKFCYENYPDIKLVLVSAYSDFEYARQALKYNVVEYITKPFTSEELTNLLIKLKEELSRVNNKATFSQIPTQLRLYKILMDIFNSNEQLYEPLERFFAESALQINPKQCGCHIIKVTFEDFEYYASNVWKHGTQRLFNAINLLVPYESDECISVVLKTDKSELEILSILKSGINSCDNFIAKLKNDFLSILELSAETVVLQEYGSVYEFIEKYGLDDENSIISTAIIFMKENLDKPVKVKEIADHVHLSEMYFCSYFKKHTGQTPISHLTELKMKKAEELLLKDSVKISNLHYMLGYKNKSHFYNVFKKFHNGQTPVEFKNSLKGRRF